MAAAKFTPQDKLALTMTSAGSQRRLAAALGITHQRLGRMLKGETQVPAELMPNINTVFKQHTLLTRQQAAVDKLPFNPDLPVFMEIKPYEKTRVVTRINRETGEPELHRVGTGEWVKGTRAMAENIQYLNGLLVKSWLTRMHLTNSFYAASVGSVINLADYPGRKPAMLGGQPELTQWFTQKEMFTLGAPDPVQALADKLVRHSVATNVPGAVLMNKIMLQVRTPETDSFTPEYSKGFENAQANQVSAAAARRSYKRTKNKRR